MLKIFIKGIFFDKSAIKKMDEYPLFYFFIIFLGTCFIFPACLTIVLKLVNFIQGSWRETIFIFISLFLRRIMISTLLFLILLVVRKFMNVQIIDNLMLLKVCCAVWFVNPIISILLEVSGSSLINIPYSIYWFVFMKCYFETNTDEKRDKILKILALSYFLLFILGIIFIKYMLYIPFFISLLIV